MKSSESPRRHSLLFRTATTVAFLLLLLATVGTGFPKVSESPLARLMKELTTIVFGSPTRAHPVKQKSSRIYQPMMSDSSRDPTSPPPPPKP